MELKEFIKEAIVQIVDGVLNAREAVQHKDVLINPALDINKNVGDFDAFRRQGYRQVQNLEINVAVTIEKESGSKAGLSIVSGLIGRGVNQSKVIAIRC